MAHRKPSTNDEREVRELTEEDFSRAIPFSTLPAELQALLSEEKQVVPDPETPSSRQPAA
jgi:hypothetical protein